MGSKTLIYKIKLTKNLNECYKHLERLNSAFEQLNKKYTFPIDEQAYDEILNNSQDLAFSDQIIYRFSKLQDTMGAKLFKSLLLYQGENVNRPFLDILNSLEKLDIIDVEEWFELRDLRNEIAHDYDDMADNIIEVLNTIYKQKLELKKILDKIKDALK